MKIIALELSSARGSLAWSDGDVEFSRDWPNDRQDSSAFFQNLAAARKEFGLPDAIVVGLGPGSYAGTRIAISAAIGLWLAGGTGSVSSQNFGQYGGRLPTKLLGYPSICAIAAEENNYCVIGDARRNSFFFARVDANKLVEGPDLLTEAELKRKLNKFGTGMSIFASQKLSQFENITLRYPSACVLAKLARDPERKFLQPPLEPMYLREPYITVPKMT